MKEKNQTKNTIIIKVLAICIAAVLLFGVLSTLLLGVAAFVGVGGVAVYTLCFRTKVYTSSVDYVLLCKGGADEDMTVEKLNNALVFGGKSIRALSSYLMTENVMSGVLDYLHDMRAIDPDNMDYVLDYTYTPSELVDLFSFQTPDEETDLVFSVTCAAYSPHDARVLLNAFSEIVNERAESVLNGVFKIVALASPSEGEWVAPYYKDRLKH